MAIITPSWQSWFNNLRHSSQESPPFAFTPCHSERSEEPPPFAPRKGARGMHTSNPQSFPRRRESRGMYGRGNIMAIISKSWQSWFNNLRHSSGTPIQRGRDGKNHGNHSHIMAIMVQTTQITTAATSDQPGPGTSRRGSSQTSQPSQSPNPGTTKSTKQRRCTDAPR